MLLQRQTTMMMTTQTKKKQQTVLRKGRTKNLRRQISPSREKQSPPKMAAVPSCNHNRRSRRPTSWTTLQVLLVLIIDSSYRNRCIPATQKLLLGDIGTGGL